MVIYTVYCELKHFHAAHGCVYNLLSVLFVTTSLITSEFEVLIGIHSIFRGLYTLKKNETMLFDSLPGLSQIPAGPLVMPGTQSSQLLLNSDPGQIVEHTEMCNTEQGGDDPKVTLSVLEIIVTPWLLNLKVLSDRGGIATD